MKRSVLILCFLLTGCATSRDIRGPDGTSHKLISCEDIEDCYDKAREECGNYKIINTSNKSFDGHSTTKLLVKCEG